MDTDPGWDDIRIFLTWLRCGSVAAAAAALAISPPTVSRRMNALQKRLGFPLLARSPQGLRLSEGAQPLVEIWQQAERLLANAPALAARMRGTQNLELRFSTTPALAAALIFPHLHGYIARWPNVRLDIHTGVRLIDIAAGQGDLALRLVEPQQGALMRQRVGTLSFNVWCVAELLPDGFRTASDWAALAATGLRAISWSAAASVSMPQQKLRKVLGAQRAGIVITESCRGGAQPAAGAQLRPCHGQAGQDRPHQCTGLGPSGADAQPARRYQGLRRRHRHGQTS